MQRHQKEDEESLFDINTIVLNLIPFLILSIFGQYLWNNILVRLIPAIQPVKNILDLVGISILFKILK